LPHQVCDRRMCREVPGARTGGMKHIPVFRICYWEIRDTVIMKDEDDNEKTLIRYLLGDLPEERRLQKEMEVLGDDQSYERLLALENELFYDYAQNKLSPGDREQFEKRFLSSSELNRKRAMIASALARKMSEAASVETTEKGIASRERRHFGQYLKSYFVAQS